MGEIRRKERMMVGRVDSKVSQQSAVHAETTFHAVSHTPAAVVVVAHAKAHVAFLLDQHVLPVVRQPILSHAD